jgi:hypothetical protein
VAFWIGAFVVSSVKNAAAAISWHFLAREDVFAHHARKNGR